MCVFCVCVWERESFLCVGFGYRLLTCVPRQMNQQNDNLKSQTTSFPPHNSNTPLWREVLVSCVHLHLWMFKHSNLQQVSQEQQHNWKIHKATREIHKWVRRELKRENNETLFSVYFCVCEETLMMVNYYKSYAHTKLRTRTSQITV